MHPQHNRFQCFCLGYISDKLSVTASVHTYGFDSYPYVVFLKTTLKKSGSQLFNDGDLRHPQELDVSTSRTPPRTPTAALLVGQMGLLSASSQVRRTFCERNLYGTYDVKYRLIPRE